MGTYQRRTPEKTVSQLERELAYHEQQRVQSKSPDRLKRAERGVLRCGKALAARGLLPRRT